MDDPYAELARVKARIAEMERYATAAPLESFSRTTTPRRKRTPPAESWSMGGSCRIRSQRPPWPPERPTLSGSIATSRP
jgi:hypothetical protein